LRDAAAGGWRDEAIGEAGPDIGKAEFGTINGYWMTMNHVEGSQIIEAVDVVGMGVGEKKMINIADAAGHGLAAKVGAAIDEQAGVMILQVDTGAGAFVSRVRGIADRAAAAKCGHARASA